MKQTTMHRWLAAGIATGIATGLLAACGGGGGDAPARSPARAAVWESPSCTTILGTAALTYTRDQGQTRIPRELELPPNHYTFGLATFADPNVLIALGDDGRGLRLQRSVDAGCSWSPLSGIIDAGFALAPLEAAQNVAYAWVRHETSMYRITSEGQVTQLELPSTVDALKVDAQDANHLRAARFREQRLQLLDSRDGGATWTEIGVSPPDANLQPVVVFSGTNLDHALALSAEGGAWVTFDGGNQWLQSTGFDDLNVPNGRSGAIGFDEQTVLLLVQDKPPSSVAARPTGVYASHDGGISFTRVLTRSATMPLSHGGTSFWAHPGEPNVFYFNSPANLYRYDAGTDTVTTVSLAASEGSVSALAFHPTDPAVVYLAFSVTLLE